LKLRAVHQHMPCCLENERNRSGVRPIEIPRIWHAIHLGTTHVLRATAVNDETEVRKVAAKVVISRKTLRAFPASHPRREDYLLAHVYRGYLGANLGNFTGHITSRNVR
jgi:hypothetical protein